MLTHYITHYMAEPTRLKALGRQKKSVTNQAQQHPQMSGSILSVK